MLWAMLEGSITVHWAFALPAPKRRHIRSAAIMYFSLAMFCYFFSLIYSGGQSSYEPYTERECPQRESQEEGDNGDTGRYDYQYYP
jgi:hypothetical protein